MDLLPGVRSQTAATDRLRVHWIESGPADGVPVVLLHGNLSTGRFFEHLMPGAPAGLRLIAPDMRGFGDTERVPIDATRGLRDWADDAAALLDALGITRPVHLAGWSTGGAAIAAFAADRPVASLTFIDPVSPYGYGGVRREGTPCCPDYAGSGGGTGSPDLTRRIAEGDRSSDDPASPRNVMNTSYWSPEHREPADREEILLGEILKSQTGDDGYPGDLVPTENWPTVAPGTRGILNASLVHPREIFREAIAERAAAIIVVHNHPSGDPTPSAEDRAITERLRQVGELVGIRVLDHVVVGQGRWASMAEEGHW